MEDVNGYKYVKSCREVIGLFTIFIYSIYYFGVDIPNKLKDNNKKINTANYIKLLLNDIFFVLKNIFSFIFIIVPKYIINVFIYSYKHKKFFIEEFIRFIKVSLILSLIILVWRIIDVEYREEYKFIYNCYKSLLWGFICGIFLFFWSFNFDNSDKEYIKKLKLKNLKKK